MIGILTVLLCAGSTGGAGALELSVEPEGLVDRGDVRLVIRADGARPADLILLVEAGEISALTARDSDWVTNWRVPVPATPRRLAAGVVDLRTGEVAFTTLAVARRLRLLVKAEPGSTVELRSSEGTLGSAQAEASGRAQLTVPVPAGIGVEAVIRRNNGPGGDVEQVQQLGPRDALRVWGLRAAREDLGAHLVLYRDSGAPVPAGCAVEVVTAETGEAEAIVPVVGGSTLVFRVDLASGSTPTVLTIRATCGELAVEERLVLATAVTQESGSEAAGAAPSDAPSFADLLLPDTLALEAGASFPQVYTGLDTFFVVGAQVGFLLPTPDQRLALVAGVDYSLSRSSGAGSDSRLPGDGSYSFDLTLHRILFDLGLLIRFLPPKSELNFYAELDVRIAIYHAEVSGEATSPLGIDKDTSFGVGAGLAGGVEWALGPGALAAELGIGFTGLDQSLTGISSAGGPSIRVGYHLFFD